MLLFNISGAKVRMAENSRCLNLNPELSTLSPPWSQRPGAKNIDGNTMRTPAGRVQHTQQPVASQHKGEDI